VIPVKLRHLTPAVFALLASTLPSVLHADTIYYRQANVSAIQSVSGTIVREANGLLEVATADGRTISILRSDVFQIVRGDAAKPAKEGQLAERSREQTTVPDGYENFSAASALANRSTLDEAPLRSAASYHYGFKGGMNISNLRADPQELEESGSLRGYALGIWWGVPLSGISRRLMIQTEAIFSMKGDSESASGYTASTHLSYFDVPILAKFDLLPDAPILPSLFVGPSLGFNLTANSSLEGEDSEVEVDVKDQVGVFDLGIVFGGGLDFQRGGRTFGVDLRYTRGLSDIGDGANGSAHNEAIAVMGSVGLH